MGTCLVAIRGDFLDGANRIFCTLNHFHGFSVCRPEEAVIWATLDVCPAPQRPLFPPGLMSARNYFVSRYFLLNPLQGEGIFVTLQLKAHSRWQPWRPLNFCSLKYVTCMDSIAKWGRQLYPRNDTQKPIITSLSHAETEARADFRGFSQRFLFFG